MVKKVMNVPQWQEFEVAILRALPKDIDPDLAQKWIEDKIGLPRALRNALIVNTVKKAEAAFTVTVDYAQSLTDMIAAGRYDWKDDGITAKHFPVSGSGQVTVGLELVHFGKVMSTVAAFAELDRRGLRPATLPELLAFGAKYPEEQRQYPIIALGSVWSHWGGNRYVACLDGNAGGRKLSLNYSDDDWDDRCRFLAASK